MKKLQKFFAWFSIFSLILQIGSGVFLYQPAFAEEEATPTPEQTETVVETPVEPQPTSEPTVTETPPAEEVSPTPTPTIEVIPSETPTEPPAEPNLTVTEPEQNLNLDPSGTDAQSAQLNPSISTDKADYAPEETVTISGSNFPANTVLLIKVTRPDGSVVKGDGSFAEGSDEITTDAEGKFTYSYKLDGILGEYKVEIFQGETVLATTTFTDSRTINWVTLNGGSSVTVSPGATITVAINVTVSGLLYNDWKSTKYQIEGESEQCVNTPDHTGKGTWTESFTITAPSAPGVYDIEFKIYKGNSCSDLSSNWYSLRNGITVSRDIVANPPLPRSCGMNMVLVLDSSDSMSGGDITTVKTSATTLVNALMPATPTQIGVIDFDTTVISFLNPTTTKANVLSAINGIGHTGATEYTNWEAALKKADDMVGADGLVVIITDGNPTTSDGPLSDLEDAIVAANALKSSGTRILAIGINSSGTSGGLNLANLIAISGPIVSPPAAVTAGTDVITGDISGLAGILADLVTALCGRTITVTKLIDADGDLGTIGDRTPGQGWTFNIGGQSGQVTDSSGKTPAVTLAIGSGYNVVETPQGGYSLLDASCTGAANNGTEDLLNNRVTGIEIASGNIVSCTFINTQVICGDGNLDPGEQCDDGTQNGVPCNPPYGGSCQYCSSSCQIVTLNGPYCGDGIVNGSEQCDGTAGVGPNQFCTTTCKLVNIYDGAHSCPANTVPVQVGGPYEIFGNDTDGINVSVTPSGKYLFEALGTFVSSSGGGWVSDAGYSSNNNWSSIDPGYGINGTPPNKGAHALLGDFGSGVGIIDWGAYNTGHVYNKYFVPNVSSLQFLIGDRYDSWYQTDWNNQTGMSDNSGYLTLNIYECQLPPVTIKAYKIVCNSEADLPNWSGTSDISQSKINSFLSSHLNCHLEPGWDFQWGFDDKTGQEGVDKLNGPHVGLADGTPSTGLCSAPYCGPNTQTGPAYNQWKTFGLTDSNGEAVALINDLEGASNIWVRESLKANYVPFTYPPQASPGSPVSAEIWCHTDVLNYDNYDRIQGVSYGQTYYCVAFNALNYGKISGTKYDDWNGNGVNDSEPGINKWTIFLDENDNGVLDGEEIYLITDDDGYYRFENLLVGSYSVCEVEQAGWLRTQPAGSNCQPATVNAGQNTVNIDFGNELQPITLELDKSNTVSGSTVTYTISVHNTAAIIAHDVKVNDMLPSGFTYNSGTTKVDSVAASDPAIAGQLLTFSLGNLNPDQTVVITYDATIGTLPDGTYPNVAISWGTNRITDHPDNETSYSNFDFSAVKIAGGFSTTTAIGGVLGISTAAVPGVLGAATGSETYWLILAILMILAGFSLKLLTKKRKVWVFKKLAKIGKRLSVLAVIVLAFMAFAGRASATIDSLFIRVADLPEYKRTDNFKLYYTALEREGKPISIVCYVEKDGGFGWKTFGGTQTEPAAYCEVFGHELDGDGTYRLKAIASSVDGSTESNVITTKIDRSGPEAPKDYRKARESSTSYKIHWKNPGNDDYAWTRIFASQTQNFTADDATKKADVGGGKDIEFDYLVTGLEPNQEYYFALQGFDKAGNASGLSGDGGTVSYVEVSPTPGAGAVAGAGEVVTLPKEEAKEGEILGGATEEPTPTEEAGGLAGAVAGVTGEGGGRNLLMFTGLGILAIAGYLLYRRRAS